MRTHLSKKCITAFTLVAVSFGYCVGNPYVRRVCPVRLFRSWMSRVGLFSSSHAYRRRSSSLHFFCGTAQWLYLILIQHFSKRFVVEFVGASVSTACILTFETRQCFPFTEPPEHLFSPGPFLLLDFLLWSSLFVLRLHSQDTQAKVDKQSVQEDRTKHTFPLCMFVKRCKLVRKPCEF